MENTSVIIFKCLSNTNNTSNRSSHENFRFHVGYTRNATEFTDFPVSVVSNTPAFSSDWRPSTIFANHRIGLGEWMSSTFVMSISTFGQVVLTRVLRNTVLMSKLVNWKWPSTVTASSNITVKNCLWWKTYSWEYIFSGYVNSVRKTTCWSKSPACSAILWDMLVSRPWEEVGSGYISPEEILWNLIRMD